MSKRNITIGLSFLIVIIIAIIINNFYLFNPLNYPKGNLELYGYKWYDFKKPIDVQCLSWYDGERLIYVPQKNNASEARYIIIEFANFKHLEDYTYEQYFDDLPTEQGKEYRIDLRLSNIREDGFAIGHILLPISFYENDNKAQVGGANFFEMPSEFKEHIIETYKDKLEY
ncbi:MAG: hypothetical protein N4A63_13090 [Vallitalea sp.]|nr:hypothetical protein [Vallitalea sp.]